MADEYKVVGKSYPRIDGREKVTGRAKYGADYSVPGMLHGKLLMPPVAHALIKSIDISEAEALYGVTVITHKDLPNTFMYPSIAGQPDMPVLASDRVLYSGDIVAAVAAETEEMAQEALKLIKVEYKPLPLVMDPEEALQPDAFQIHADRQGNLVLSPAIEEKGDVEEGFRQADHIIERKFVTAQRTQGTIEPLNATVWWDDPDHIVFFSSYQSVFHTRTELANLLGLPATHVRGIGGTIGGSFGSKNTSRAGYGRHIAIAALLAKKSGKPVKVIIPKEQSLALVCRWPVPTRWKVGFKNDGTITAYEVTTLHNAGAYGTGLYDEFHPFVNECPNTRRISKMVYTNTAIGGFMRAVTQPSILYGWGQIVDEIANFVKKDPLDYNIDTAKKESNIDPLRQAAEAFKWKERWHKPGAGAGTKKRGIGMQMAAFKFQGGSYSHVELAVVRAFASGEVQLCTAIADVGQGTPTGLQQMCAEELGLPFERVTHIYKSDTAYSPYTEGIMGSHSAASYAHAIRAACADLKTQILDAAAKVLQAAAEELEIDFAKSIVHVKADPEKVATFYQIFMMHRFGFVVLLYNIGEVCHIEGRGYSGSAIVPTHDASCVMAEVEVDTETGDVQVLNMITAFNCGKAINPMLLTSQLTGGIIQGIMHTRAEEMLYDPRNGKMINNNYLEYKLPTTKDIHSISALYNEYPDPVNPYGMKPAAEWSTYCTGGAIANAIFNATGVRVTHEPCTPDKVLKALEKI